MTLVAAAAVGEAARQDEQRRRHGKAATHPRRPHRSRALLLAPRAAAQEALAVEIAPTARLIQGGKAVAVQVTVTCPTGAEVLEAFLYVNQDGNQGQYASFQPVCDGTPHTFMVRAQAGFGFRYHVGEATVSGYVLLSNLTSTSPGQTVTLQRGQI
jgi:hypothetical protein